jgi:hypothetical protein
VVDTIAVLVPWLCLCTDMDDEPILVALVPAMVAAPHQGSANGRMIGVVPGLVTKGTAQSYGAVGSAGAERERLPA